MKQFALQTKAADISIDDLSAARTYIGSFYYHRPYDNAPFVLVYNPPDLTNGQRWVTEHGWLPLPHVLDHGSSIGPDISAGLLHHAPDVLPTDTCSAAMTKVMTATGMGCWNPWS